MIIYCSVWSVWTQALPAAYGLGRTSGENNFTTRVVWGFYFRLLEASWVGTSRRSQLFRGQTAMRTADESPDHIEEDRGGKGLGEELVGPQRPDLFLQVR